MEKKKPHLSKTQLSSSRFNKSRSPRNNSAVFNDESSPKDITASAVDEARKTGSLDLSSRSLCQIPDRVWSLNEIRKEETKTLSVSLDNPNELKWWEFQELKKLILAHNCIDEVPSQIQRLAHLQILDIHDNRIVSIPSEIGSLINITKLILSRNKIEVLPIELYNLTNLIELKIGNNNLKEIQSEIGSLVNLKELELQFNQIAKLPPDIGFLSMLTKLNLCKNKLDELPPDFSSLMGLRHLDISDNLLTDVGSIFSEFRHLEVLYLQKNKLKHIPILENAKKLTELHMNFNRVTKFNSSIFGGTIIRLIDLRTNKINELDIVVDDLELLDRFYLDDNNIENIPPELSILPALKQVTLVGNPLKGIRIDILQRGPSELLKYLRNKIVTEASPNGPEIQSSVRGVRNPSGGSRPANIEDLEIDIHKLKASRQLSLTSKQIKELPVDVFEKISEVKINQIDLSQNLLSFLPQSFETVCANLTELTLDKNKFTTLPLCIGTSCPHLYFLTFQNNQVKELPIEFSNLKKLREINFSFNAFASIPDCLYELPALEIILAESNKIEKLDVEKLRVLRKLATLNLDNNNIAVCPPELGTLPLTHLSIQGNVFRIPPYHILAKGTEATMSYLRNRVAPPKDET